MTINGPDRPLVPVWASRLHNPHWAGTDPHQVGGQWTMEKAGRLIAPRCLHHQVVTLSKHATGEFERRPARSTQVEVEMPVSAIDSWVASSAIVRSSTNN